MIAAGGKKGQTLILDAAVRTFLAVGYEGASMEAVAAEAGVARRTVFNQFGSKEGLFGAAVERLWQRLDFAADLEQEDQAVTAEQTLLKMADRIVGFWQRPEAVPFARLVITEGERFPVLRDSFILRGRQPTHEALTACFRELVKRGDLVRLDPILAAEQFVSLIKDVLWWPVLIGQTDLPDANRRRQVIEAAVNVMLSAYSR